MYEQVKFSDLVDTNSHIGENFDMAKSSFYRFHIETGHRERNVSMINNCLTPRLDDMATINMYIIKSRYVLDIICHDEHFVRAIFEQGGDVKRPLRSAI